METNFLFIVLAALVPMLMGMVWYNPKVFGKAWMEGVGVSQEILDKGPQAGGICFCPDPQLHACIPDVQHDGSSIRFDCSVCRSGRLWPGRY